MARERTKRTRKQKTKRQTMETIENLKQKLDQMRDDLHAMAFSEMPLDALVNQSNRIRAMKSRITRTENAILANIRTK
jgi:hypothetical protein